MTKRDVESRKKSRIKNANRSNLTQLRSGLKSAPAMEGYYARINEVRSDYPQGTVESSILHGAKTIDVFCGTVVGQRRCGYVASIQINNLPRVTWREIGRRLRCQRCGVKGDVHIRFRHNEGYTGRAPNIIDGKLVY